MTSLTKKVINTAGALALGAATVIADGTNNEAEAGGINLNSKGFYACVDSNRRITGNIQCVKVSKRVFGRDDRPGPALISGYGYIRGPQDADYQHERLGRAWASAFGLRHSVRVSFGCDGGFLEPYRDSRYDNRTQEYCGTDMTSGSAEVLRSGITGQVKGFSSYSAAQNWLQEIKNGGNRRQSTGTQGNVGCTNDLFTRRCP